MVTSSVTRCAIIAAQPCACEGDGRPGWLCQRRLRIFALKTYFTCLPAWAATSMTPTFILATRYTHPFRHSLIGRLVGVPAYCLSAYLPQLSLHVLPGRAAQSGYWCELLPVRRYTCALCLVYRLLPRPPTVVHVSTTLGYRCAGQSWELHVTFSGQVPWG